jgi:SAM-dependent methyltransferase
VTEPDPALWTRRAASFGTTAAAYAAHRPDYAADAIRWCLSGADRRVVDALDLGAGTGAVTAGLVAAGVSVVAVEPDGAMLAELRRMQPGVPAALGRAEAIPLRDQAVDAVVVGTAFHWFDAGRALVEIARVLRPGGVLALLDNSDDSSAPWVAELREAARSSVSSPPEDFDWAPSFPGFGPVTVARFPHRHRRTAESLTATIGTHSHTLVISSAERTELLTRVRQLLESYAETAQGEFDYPLTTIAGRAVVDPRT